MNKNLIKFSAFVLGLSLFASCQKDLTNSKVETPQLPPTAERTDLTYVPEYETYELPVEKARVKIAALEESFKNGGLQTRGDNNISVAEAVWNIEALTNKNTAQAGWKAKKMEVATSYIPLETTTVGGAKQVSMSEVSTKLASAISSVNQAVSSVPVPSANKQTIYADVTPMVDNDGGVVLALSVGIGIDPPPCPGCLTPYEDPIGGLGAPGVNCLSSNCWKTSAKLGTCNNPNTGFGAGQKDATDIIEDYIFQAAQTDACPGNIMAAVINPGGILPSNYYTSLVPAPTFYPDNNTQNPNWSPGDPAYKRYRLFKSSQNDVGGYVDCLNPVDLLYFSRGSIDIILNHKIQNPAFWQGRYYVSCDVKWSLLGNFTLNRVHTIDFKVGIRSEERRVGKEC